MVRKTWGMRRTVCVLFPQREKARDWTLLNELPKWFVLRGFECLCSEAQRNLEWRSISPLYCSSLSGPGWLWKERVVILPKSEKFGLQSGLDPRAVKPDIPVLRVCGILSISDCHDCRFFPLHQNGAEF